MIEVRGQAGVLAVDDGGEGGPPCFLVHSLGGRLAFWNDVLTDLRQHRRAVALDLRGHGASEPASFAQSGLDDFADDVLRVADELGLKRFVLVDPAGVFNQVPASALEGFIEQVLGDGGEAFVREAYETNLERAVPATRAAVLESLAATDRATLAGAYTALLPPTRAPSCSATRGRCASSWTLAMILP